MKKVLTIAGSDCSGGAGIQADIKTITVHKCYAMSVITNLTAQNTLGVKGVFPVSKEFVKKQLDSIFTDIKPDAVKIGMVGSKEIIMTICDYLKKKKVQNIVIDPVMISSTKAKLIEDDAIEYLKNNLLKIATVVTPNLDEMEALMGFKIRLPYEYENACLKLTKFTDASILLKGGHNELNSNDLLYHDKKFYWLNAKKINNKNIHGTGCTLSSAIAANLAKGYDVVKSVKKAKQYVNGAIKRQLNLGKGIGPLEHTYKI